LLIVSISAGGTNGCAPCRRAGTAGCPLCGDQ
jgi:hypothetical protein